MALRHNHWRIASWSALCLALVLAVGWSFDELWLRPLLQSYVREHSGRRIDFEAIHLGLDDAWQPSVRFKNVTIENAAWASSRQPLIRAGGLGLAFTWASLAPRAAVVVTRMSLKDADIDLEILADGLRNWRLVRPDDRGPGRIRVLELDAQGVRARFVHRGVDLEVTLESTLLPTARPAPLQGAAALTRTIAIHGVRHDMPFDGQWASSDVLGLDPSGAWASLDGHLDTAHAKVALRGRARGLLQLGALEGDAQLSGNRVGELATVFGPRPLNVPALATRFESHVVKDGEHWRFDAVSGRFGDSDIAGSVDYRSNKASGARPDWQATLTSTRLNLTQLRGHADDPRERHDFRAAPDARVDWKIDAVQGLPVALGALHAVLNAQSGTLRLDPVDFSVAGGRVNAKLTLDTTTVPESASAELRVAGVQAERLGVKNVAGQLDARLVLQSRGDSQKTLMAGLAGTAAASLSKASLPAKLEAELGLDGGRWLQSLVAGDQRVPVLCSTLQVQVENGIGRVRRLALETGNLLLNGSGSVDLPGRSVDVVLTPHRKHAALVALDRSVRLSGAFKAVQVAVVANSDTSRREPCAGARAAIP